MQRLSNEDEARRIIEIYGRDVKGVAESMERQFAVLAGRSQVLLALCGIIIGTSGIAGRFIASTGPLAQGLVVGGVGSVLAASMVVCLGVLHLHWLTQHEGALIEPWLRKALFYRDRKTRLYRLSLLLLLLGLALYVAALLAMLAYPEAAASLTPPS